MRMQYYQVTGRGPWTIDYPGGETKAHRPGDTVGPVSPSNKGVVRGLRSKRLRQMSEREAKALRASATIATLKPLSSRDDVPIVIVPDEPPRPTK